MTYDGKLLARARAALDVQREANQAEQQRRMLRVYQEIPEIELIDRTLRSHMAELVKLTLSRPSDLKDRLAALQDRNLDLQMRRAELLTEHGYSIDYLDEIVSCPRCRDTGYDGTEVCDCLKRRYNLELTKEKQSLPDVKSLLSIFLTSPQIFCCVAGPDSARLISLPVLPAS